MAIAAATLSFAVPLASTGENPVHDPLALAGTTPTPRHREQYNDSHGLFPRPWQSGQVCTGGVTGTNPLPLQTQQVRWLRGGIWPWPSQNAQRTAGGCTCTLTRPLQTGHMLPLANVPRPRQKMQSRSGSSIIGTAPPYNPAPPGPPGRHTMLGERSEPDVWTFCFLSPDPCLDAVQAVAVVPCGPSPTPMAFFQSQFTVLAPFMPRDELVSSPFLQRPACWRRQLRLLRSCPSPIPIGRNPV